MGLFDKILRKKSENSSTGNIATNSNSKEKQKSPVKETEVSEKRSASKWNDLEYLISLDKALKSNPQKPIMQTIADTDQALANKRQQSSEKAIELTTKTDENQSSTPFNVKITTRLVERDPIGELSHLDFRKPAGILGCFLNYEPKVLREPTEKQLSYLKDLGVLIPDGITKDDASYMISRATGDDDMESPGPELVSLAVGLGIRFSAFIGATGLLRQIVRQTGERDRAALFGYAVRQSLRGSDLGNMLDDPAVGSFYSFADQVIADPALLRSLNGREPADYIHPYKGTAIYKAAARFLGSGA